MGIKQYIADKIEEEGNKYGEKYILSGYDERIEELSKIAVNKIVSQATEDSGDVQVRYKGKKYIAEVDYVSLDGDTEVDIRLISEKEYEEQYGHKYGEGF